MLHLLGYSGDICALYSACQHPMLTDASLRPALLLLSLIQLINMPCMHRETEPPVSGITCCCPAPSAHLYAETCMLPAEFALTHYNA